MKGFIPRKLKNYLNYKISTSQKNLTAFSKLYTQISESPLYSLYDRAVHGGPGCGHNMMSPGQWSLLKAWVETQSPKSCLDLGCGSGAFFLHMQELNKKLCVGIDQNLEALRIAKNLNPEVQFQQIEIGKIKKLEGNWDAIVSIDSFYHLKNPRKLIASLYDSLNSNGQLIIALSESQALNSQEIKSLFQSSSFLSNKVEFHNFTSENRQMWARAEEFFSELVTRQEREQFPLLWQSLQKETAKRLQYFKDGHQRLLIKAVK